MSNNIVFALQSDIKPKHCSHCWQQPTVRAIKRSSIIIIKSLRGTFLQRLPLVHFLFDYDLEQFSWPITLGILSLSWGFTWLDTECIGVIGIQCFWHFTKLAICAQCQERCWPYTSTSPMHSLAKVIAAYKVISWKYHPCVFNICG